MMNEIYFACGCLLLIGIILFTIIDFYAYIHAPRSARKRSLTAWLVIKLIVMLTLIWLSFVAIFYPGSLSLLHYTVYLAISSQLFWSKMMQPEAPFFQKLRVAFMLLALVIMLCTLATWAFAPLPHFR